MVGQATQIIFVVTICALINVWILHSGNLEMICLTGFVTFVTWVLVGSFLIYHAQNKMKKWYEYEKYAHNGDELHKLQTRYEKVYEEMLVFGPEGPPHNKQHNKNKKWLDENTELLEYLILRL